MSQSISYAERAARYYLSHADTAREGALNCKDPAVQKAFLALATEWEDLALAVMKQGDGCIARVTR